MRLFLLILLPFSALLSFFAANLWVIFFRIFLTLSVVHYTLVKLYYQPKYINTKNFLVFRMFDRCRHEIFRYRVSFRVICKFYRREKRHFDPNLHICETVGVDEIASIKMRTRWKPCRAEHDDDDDHWRVVDKNVRFPCSLPSSHPLVMFSLCPDLLSFGGAINSLTCYIHTQTRSQRGDWRGRGQCPPRKIFKCSEKRKRGQFSHFNPQNFSLPLQAFSLATALFMYILLIH